MTYATALAAAGLTLPDYGGRDLGAVLPAALSALGVDDAVTGRDAGRDRALLNVPESTHVVVVLLDGLGQLQLEERRGHAPFLKGLMGATVDSGYPSTTVASLAMLGTGQSAGRTGMAGYTVRNPRTGTLANLIKWEGADAPEEWQREPSLLDEAVRAGVSVTTLGKRKFAGSGLTQAALRGGAFVGTDRLAERIDAAARLAGRRGLTYCYWGEIDAAGHKHGWRSDQWVAALEDADRELARLARSLPAGATMLVTADHGMVDVTGAPRWDVTDEPELSRDVELVAGEPRALHLHLVPGSDAVAVAARWQEFLGADAVVGTRSEVAEAGLFGEITPAVAERIGEVVVAMAGRATVVDSRTQTPASLQLVGVHGSLTPDEIKVPLLTASS